MQKGKTSLEKGMALHSHIFAWRITWTEGSGGLQSIESQTIGHNLANKYTVTNMV